MEKTGTKRRDINFFSAKNQEMVCVHSEAAREYARILEQDANVAGYEAGKILQQEKYQYVDPLDIRKDYFGIQWESDFLIRYTDGKVGIREIVMESMLEKRAAIEKLEFSRRYWSASAIDDWRIVIMEKGA